MKIKSVCTFETEAQLQGALYVHLCSCDILQLSPQTTLYFSPLLIKQLFFQSETKANGRKATF